MNDISFQWAKISQCLERLNTPKQNINFWTKAFQIALETPNLKKYLEASLKGFLQSLKKSDDKKKEKKGLALFLKFGNMWKLGSPLFLGQRFGQKRINFGHFKFWHNFYGQPMSPCFYFKKQLPICLTKMCWMVPRHILVLPRHTLSPC